MKTLVAIILTIVAYSAFSGESEGERITRLRRVADDTVRNYIIDSPRMLDESGNHNEGERLYAGQHGEEIVVGIYHYDNNSMKWYSFWYKDGKFQRRTGSPPFKVATWKLHEQYHGQFR